MGVSGFGYGGTNSHALAFGHNATWKQMVMDNGCLMMFVAVCQELEKINWLAFCEARIAFEKSQGHHISWRQPETLGDPGSNFGLDLPTYPTCKQGLKGQKFSINIRIYVSIWFYIYIYFYKYIILVYLYTTNVYISCRRIVMFSNTRSMLT